MGEHETISYEKPFVLIPMAMEDTEPFAHENSNTAPSTLLAMATSQLLVFESPSISYHELLTRRSSLPTGASAAKLLFRLI